MSLIENGATHSDIVHDEPEAMTLADMRISPAGPGDRSLDCSTEPELVSLPLELEDEFQTLSEEMQRYIKFMLNRRGSGNSVNDLSVLDLPKRGARTLTSFPVAS